MERLAILLLSAIVLIDLTCCHPIRKNVIWYEHDTARINMRGTIKDLRCYANAEEILQITDRNVNYPAAESEYFNRIQVEAEGAPVRANPPFPLLRFDVLVNNVTMRDDGRRFTCMYTDHEKSVTISHYPKVYGTVQPIYVPNEFTATFDCDESSSVKFYYNIESVEPRRKDVTTYPPFKNRVHVNGSIMTLERVTSNDEGFYMCSYGGMNKIYRLSVYRPEKHIRVSFGLDPLLTYYDVYLKEENVILSGMRRATSFINERGTCYKNGNALDVSNHFRLLYSKHRLFLMFDTITANDEGLYYCYWTEYGKENYLLDLIYVHVTDKTTEYVPLHVEGTMSVTI